MTEKQTKSVTSAEEELDEIRSFIERQSGILFDASRERFFSARIREHMAEKRLAGGTDLIAHVRNSPAAYDALLETLLTQETSFFRYPAIIEAFQKRVLPEMHRRKFWDNPRRLRVWSAACATGEEPYSIAIAIADALDLADAWNIEILATDISRRALRVAGRGVYPKRSLANLSPQQMEDYFSAGKDGYRVQPRICRMVSFGQMNLAQGVHVGRMDCIFCMNVLMYFSEQRRHALIQRFHEHLEPGGYLFLGHAESVAQAPVKFETFLHGACILYRKPGAQVAQSATAAVEESS